MCFWRRTNTHVGLCCRGPVPRNSLIGCNHTIAYPPDVAGPARIVDKALWTAACECTTDLEGDKRLGIVKTRVHLPVKLKGMGLRSLEVVAPMAFMGGLEQSIPFFVKEGQGQGETGGHVPLLKDQIGLNSFRVGPLALKQGHWERLLSSGCRTGLELRSAHHVFRDLVQQAREEELPSGGRCRILGEAFKSETGDPSLRQVASFTGAAHSIGISKLMVAELERVRAAQLNWKVQKLPRDDYLREAVDNCDVETSGKWVYAPPIAEFWMDNFEFPEVTATYLGLQSPGCKGRVGQDVAGKRRRAKRGELQESRAGWMSMAMCLLQCAWEMTRVAASGPDTTTLGLR